MHIADTRGERAIRERAYKLAESGRFGAVRDVERALIGEGWPNAHRVMHSDYVMQTVEEKCRAAYSGAH